MKIKEDWFEPNVLYVSKEMIEDHERIVKEEMNNKQITKEDLNYKERKMEKQVVYGPSNNNPPNMDQYKMSPTGFSSNLDWIDVSKLTNNSYNYNQPLTSNCYIDWNHYHPYQNYYVQTCPQMYVYEDKTKKSFELVKKLIDEGLMQEPKTIKDFIELVTKVSNLI